jgi:hypothetical protein
MKIVFHENFGQVWTDDVSPYVFTLITQIPPSSPYAVKFFQSQIDLAQSLQKKFKESYLISDFSETTEETRELLCHYYMEFIPKLMKNKISYIAFVCPHSTFESLSKEKKEMFEQAPLGIFPTFAEALAAVNLTHSLELVQRMEEAY